MPSHLSLPNELLQAIIELIAYTPQLPNSTSKSLLNSASPELLALSVANWQLRRICQPLLFANIRILRSKDAKKLKSDAHLKLLSKFTKFLAINMFFRSAETGYSIVSQSLPQFKQLLRVELPGCRRRPALLKVILAHPTVTSVLVNELPDESLCDDDLSKVILQSEPSYRAFSPMYKKYFNQGMQLMCLDLYKPDSFDEQFGSMVFSGLKKIQMHMGIIPVSFSFLYVLLLTHPTLNELWILDGSNHYFARHTPPFLSSFIQESRSQQQDLTKLFIVRKVGLHRAIGLSSQEWSIMGLTLD
ncbi:hypothetical protein F5878DRAFT_672675 [Lentinula raphanica]|uniref:Uncharacterized protein n=1 Tax=Lentinula raphanica TaxID=153919 RepID=A0AA38UAD2_9AGAR|nr:hypothetical protein F5878DRAFT_672675 [Lentinula raphanica]